MNLSNQVISELSEAEDYVKFYIEDSEGNSATLELTKQGSKWKEKFSNKKGNIDTRPNDYMGYLKPKELKSWLSKDYDVVKQL